MDVWPVLIGSQCMVEGSARAILKFWTRDPRFSCYTGPYKLCSQFYLLLVLWSPTTLTLTPHTSVNSPAPSPLQAFVLAVPSAWLFAPVSWCDSRPQFFLVSVLVLTFNETCFDCTIYIANELPFYLTLLFFFSAFVLMTFLHMNFFLIY